MGTGGGGFTDLYKQRKRLNTSGIMHSGFRGWKEGGGGVASMRIRFQRFDCHFRVIFSSWAQHEQIPVLDPLLSNV